MNITDAASLELTPDQMTAMGQATLDRVVTTNRTISMDPPTAMGGAPRIRIISATPWSVLPSRSGCGSS